MNIYVASIYDALISQGIRSIDTATTTRECLHKVTKKKHAPSKRSTKLKKILITSIFSQHILNSKIYNYTVLWYQTHFA